MLAPVARPRFNPAPLKRAAPAPPAVLEEAPQVAADGLDTHRGSALGWVGHNSLSATIRQNDNQTDVTGWLGDASVDLQETVNGDHASIDGWLMGNGGSASVSLAVDHKGSTITWSGFMGRAFVNLQQTDTGGNGWITGWVGDRSVNLSRTTRGNSIDYSGSVNGAAGSSFVSAHADFDQATRDCDPLVPLLALG